MSLVFSYVYLAIRRLHWRFQLIAAICGIITMELEAQQDALIYTDKAVYFPGDAVCLRVIWPEPLHQAYLQLTSNKGEAYGQFILDFDGERTYSNCISLADTLRAGNYLLTVVDKNGLALSTGMLLYSPDYAVSSSQSLMTWSQPANLKPIALDQALGTMSVTGPAKEEQLRLQLPERLSAVHLSITDSKFSVPGTWMHQQQLAVPEAPEVIVTGTVLSSEVPSGLLLANLVGAKGDFSGATIQPDGSFRLADLAIKGPTMMKLFLPTNMEGAEVKFDQWYPKVSVDTNNELLIPADLKTTMDLYYKMSIHYPVSEKLQYPNENNLFTGIKRTYLLNEYLPLPTIEDIITDILVGVKVVKEAGTPIDIVIKDDALQAMDEQVSPLIFVNNNLLKDNRKVFSLPVEAISNLSVIPSVDSRDIFGYVGLGGALSITTETEIESIQPDAEAVIQGPLLNSGVPKPEIYAHKPDYRSTLLWTDTEYEKTIKVPVVTTSFSGEYYLRVSGIDQLGQVVYYEDKILIKFVP